MNKLYFGTDGIRGPFGGPLVNAVFFEALGSAVSSWLGKKGARGAAPRTIFIGTDTRLSGDVLSHALARGFAAGGYQPTLLGVVPTPAVSRAVRAGGAALGAVITASHNPAEDNGVKFFGPDGAKLSDADEIEIEGLIDTIARNVAWTAEYPREAVLGAYIEAASSILPQGALRGWKVALDTANGATAASSPAVFRALGAEVVGQGDRPDGLNINKAVGSEHPEALSALVVSSQARLGVAHDGDGDRCILCDESGGILDGDEILSILATHALARGTLAKGTLVVTVQSNLGVDAAVESAGGRVVRTKVGDRYVSEAMRVEGATLGGESSGHIVCFEFGPTGDGLAAALKVISVMLETGKPLSELRKVLRRFPQCSASLSVREKRPIGELKAVTGAVRDLERELGTKGRVLVRYSGTEPKLRLLVEGPTEASVSSGIARLSEAARRDLDVL